LNRDLAHGAGEKILAYVILCERGQHMPASIHHCLRNFEGMANQRVAHLVHQDRLRHETFLAICAKTKERIDGLNRELALAKAMLPVMAERAIGGRPSDPARPLLEIPLRHALRDDALAAALAAKGKRSVADVLAASDAELAAFLETDQVRAVRAMLRGLDLDMVVES
jgi:hypothetical protein